MEMYSAVFLASLNRKPPQTQRDRVRTPIIAAILGGVFAWFFLLFSLEPWRTSATAAAVWWLFAVASICLLALNALYWVAYLRWPFNPLGFLLMTGGTSISTVPSDEAAIRQHVLAEWERRFGSDLTRDSERVWAMGRRVNTARLAPFTLTICVVLAVPHRPLVLCLLIIGVVGSAMIWLMVLQTRFVGERERTTHKIVAALHGSGFPDFPPLDPAQYHVWLDRLREQDHVNDV